MLVKKENSSSAQVIPLTTAFAMFGSTEGFNGKYTMSLQPMVSTEKVFFPGNNALVIGQHQTYNNETDDFCGINQAVSSLNGGDGGGDSWGPNVNLTASLMDNSWYKEFNRISNWCNFSQYPNNESANYYSSGTSEVVRYTPNNFTENLKIDLGVSYIQLRSLTASASIIEWANHTGVAKYRLKFDGTTPMTVQVGDENWVVITGIAINTESTPVWPDYSASFFARVSDNFPDYNIYRYEFDRNFNSCTTGELSNLGPLVLFNSTEELYTSGITANANILNDGTNFNITGNDLKFYFNTTGNNVTGKVQKGNQPSLTANVTANVTYTSAVNNEQNHDVTNYNWPNSSGTRTTIGGGGGYSYSISFYPPYSNKNLINPTSLSTVEPISEYRGFRMVSKNNIPDTYGGAMLFSGNNLAQYFNQNNKYYCIGFKGVSYYTAQDDSLDISATKYNWEGKLYKFNDEHFKKINNDTFVFFDDEISKIYTCFEASHGFGVKNRKYAPIGPMFMKFTGYTHIEDSQSTLHKTFDINTSNIYNIPTVLHTINYIKSFDPEVNPDPRYIITKPTSSILYGSDGYDKNFGSTDTYSYLALQLPTNIVTNIPICFENNITEITQLGNSIKAVTGLYRQSTSLTALTAVKATFDNCMNVKSMSNLFAGATALKELPSDWGNLVRLTGAQNLCEDCSALTSVPDCYNLTNLTYAPNMYKNCVNVSSMPDGNMTALTGASSMYEGCSSITGNRSDKMIPPTPWRNFAPNLKNANDMFKDCSKITDIQTDFNNLTQLDNFSGMFMNCTAITSDIGPILDYIISHFYPGAESVYGSAFMGCTGVKSGTNDYQAIINDQTPVAGTTKANGYYKYLFGLV